MMYGNHLFIETNLLMNQYVQEKINEFHSNFLGIFYENQSESMLISQKDLGEASKPLLKETSKSR